MELWYIVLNSKGSCPWLEHAILMGRAL